jgi:hypothetical protein
MKHTAALLLGISLLTPTTFSAGQSPEQDPVVWGILSNNSGCVIFAEGHKTSGRFS